MNLSEQLSRRAFVGRGLAAGALALAGALVRPPAAAETAPVDPSDPNAKALGYTTTSQKADQKCASCGLFKGNAGDSQGPCLLFQGRSVSAGGWCMGWAKKP
jgi:anaerobic selenocysteine-containing dehydrogenase